MSIAKRIIEKLNEGKFDCESLAHGKDYIIEIGVLQDNNTKKKVSYCVLNSGSIVAHDSKAVIEYYASKDELKKDYVIYSTNRQTPWVSNIIKQLKPKSKDIKKLEKVLVSVWNGTSASYPSELESYIDKIIKLTKGEFPNALFNQTN